MPTCPCSKERRLPFWATVQGHAQAQNLRDSGCTVIIGQRAGGPNYDLAKSHGFDPQPVEEARFSRADIVNILLPDEVQGDIYRAHDQAASETGQYFDEFPRVQYPFRPGRTPPGVDTLLVAPKGPGHLVRSEFERGGGVPCLIAVVPGASEETKKIGLAYAKGIGGTRGGVIETTIRGRNRDRPVW